MVGRGRASRPLALDEEAKCLFKRPRRLPVGEKLFDDLLVWRDDFMQNVSANNPNLGTQLVTEGIQPLAGLVAPREPATMSA